jgi:hypothetical protein
MTESELKTQIREMTLRRLRAQMEADSARQAAMRAEQSPTVNANEKRVVREAVLVAQQELSDVEAQLGKLRRELLRRERISERPKLEALLKRALAVVNRRNRLAAEAQRCLEDFNEHLVAMDECREELLAVERQRDPSAAGMTAIGSMVFTPLNSAMRLRPSLCGALRGTSYANAIRQPLLTVEEEDFSRIEAAACAKVIARLEADLRAVDELSKEEVA